MSLVSCEADRLAEHYDHPTFDFGDLMCKTVTGDVFCSTDSKLLEHYGTLTSCVYVKQLPDYFDGSERVEVLKKYLDKQNNIDFLATVNFLEVDAEKKVLIYDLPKGEMLRAYIQRQTSNIDYQQVAFLFIKLKDMLEQLALVGMQHGRIEVDSIYMSNEGHLYLLDSAIVAAKHELVIREIITFQVVPNNEAITASPELCFGRNTTVRDDVFNLSLLAYQLLYNSHPYAGENSVQALMKKSQAVRLDEMNDSQWAIFQQGLAFHANRRFASISELIEALLCVNNSDGQKIRLIKNSFSFLNLSSYLKGRARNKLWLMILASLGGISGAVLMSQILSS